MVRLIFSELLADDADNPAHFVIDPALEIERVFFGDTHDILYLMTEPQVNEQRYSVRVIREDTNGDGVISGDDQILTDIAGNPVDPDFDSAEFSGISEEVYAIVDVMVSDDPERHHPAPGYTGMSFDQCTNPYVPGEIDDTQLEGRDVVADVNDGIGGSTTSIWVKYEAIPTTSDQPVVTGISVEHWVGWNAYCPEGWVVAHGYSRDIQGALTTGTWDDCWRNGLCVRYEPMSEARISGFVSNVSFSWGPALVDCVAPCESNEEYWPEMVTVEDPLDVHSHCGDDNYLYVCFNQATAEP
jgi:hypothetical protein